MSCNPLRLVFVSSPIGHLGSGRAGGVELTITSLMEGLLALGHQLTLVAPADSFLPQSLERVRLIQVAGIDQKSWQQASPDDPLEIPVQAVLPKLWENALSIDDVDAIVNFSYDWLPIWLTPFAREKLFHLISMGSVSHLMQSVIEDLAQWNQSRLAFHSKRQAEDFLLPYPPIVVGNGFNLSKYDLRLEKSGPLGWAGRVAPKRDLKMQLL